MAVTAYTLVQKVHFADMLDGDVAGNTGDALVVDSVTSRGSLYSSGVLVGTPFNFSSAQAAALVSAGWLSANATYSGVPGGKGVVAGWHGVVTGTAGATTSFTAGAVVAGRVAFTIGADATVVNETLAALITDLTAAGVIGA